MDGFSQSAIATVVICNTFEAYAGFINRADRATRDRLAQALRAAGERSLLWVGDRKLVVTSGPVAHHAYLAEHIGYRETQCIFPTQPSDYLSQDIVAEPALLHQLVAYAGPERELQLVPYATTPQFLQLVETLQTHHRVTVRLPESPEPMLLWLRDYIESKVGFRAWVGAWLRETGARLPEGYVAQTIEQAGAIARWFGQRQQPCIVKSNTGFLGIGQIWLTPADQADVSSILHANPFYVDDLLVVEEQIVSTHDLSPSVEFVVPPLEEGAPRLTHVCNQIFRAAGQYVGELVSKEWQQADWYAPLVNSGFQVALRLQAMGYVGHFDIDSIVSDAGEVFLLEVNARRTGGTHVHELAQFLLGDDYLDRVAVLGRTSLPCGEITSLDALLKAIAPVLYPIAHEPRGVIITHTAALPSGQFGYVLFGRSTDDVLSLQQQLIQYVSPLG